MNYIKSVKHSSKKIIKTESYNYGKKENLQNILKSEGLDVKIGKSLKGGYVSNVYDGTLDGQKIVIKHTADLDTKDPTQLFRSANGHNVDTYVLKKLSNSDTVRVPKVLYHFPDLFITIMEDLRQDSFQLLQNQILIGKINIQQSYQIGKSLSSLLIETQSRNKFQTNDSPIENIFERGLELRLAFPNNQREYLELEEKFITDTQQWISPDTHPKNCFTNTSNKIARIDFGCSHRGDKDFVLPNFLAHIIVYGIGGYLEKNELLEFIQRTVNGYKSNNKEINEEYFCKYLGMEILHRSYGKRITGVNSVEQKVNLVKLGLTIFHEKISSIDEVIILISEV